MQTAAQDHPVTQEPAARNSNQRNPTQGQPPPRRNQDLEARNKAAAEFLRQQRGVEPPAPKDPPAKPEERPAPEAPPPAKPNDNPVVTQKPTPDMIALAKAERQEAERARAEAERLKQETEQQLNSAKDDPIGFLAKLGMTEEDWKKFNAGGGMPPQVAKALREQQEYRAASEKRIAELEARATKAIEDRDIGSVLNQYPLVRKLGGADAARAHAMALKNAGTPASTWGEVMQSLEAQYQTGLSNIFADAEINAKYGFKPQQQAPAPVNSPTTLVPSHASAGNYLDANAKNPFPYGSPENLNWKRKRVEAQAKGAIKA